MEKFSWFFFFLSLGAVTCMIGMGIAVSFKSVIGAAGAGLLLAVIMGYGFKTKKMLNGNN